MAGRPAVSASSKWLEGIRKWYYNAAGFNKLGLMRDDTIHENDDVKEAIRRLPENLYNDRVFRIKRALDLSMRQQILPKEQWTKYEEQLSGFQSLLDHRKLTFFPAPPFSESVEAVELNKDFIQRELIGSATKRVGECYNEKQWRWLSIEILMLKRTCLGLLEKVVAVYNYAKEKEDELSFQEKANMLSRGMKML
ncbi:hypothetical protein MJT46_009329 [Ovis ammon polii x Ovis aries]|nr:hypothetical protein MJT46_009329 [Ovis ammon polii x Ovis aries]